MPLRLSALCLAVLLTVLLLCQCALKHQPVVFGPYFSLLPDDYPGPTLVGQIRELEERPFLTPLEKKRLYDLFTMEARTLRTNSQRFQMIAERAEKLKPEVESLQNDIGRLKAEIIAANVQENSKPQFDNLVLRKEFQTAYQLWNKDENDKALRKVDQIVQNKDLKNAASQSEWIRVLNLRFRVAMDLFQRPTMDEAYEHLKNFADCAPETANAGFILALFAFVDGNNSKALKIFQDQCDRDDSYTNQLRRSYWSYRFQEKDKEAGEKAFNEMNKIPAPGYYAYLARAMRGEKMQIQLPNVSRTPLYLTEEWSVKKEAHELFLAAEERLRLGMRRDAAPYIGKAVLSLKNDPEDNLVPLLYAAYLYRASGNHLESMKIFTLLSGAIKVGNRDAWNELEGDLANLFPRPFAPVVEGSAKDWKIDPDFVYAIMRQESAFNPGATSSADAKGLMQMMPQLGKALATQWKSGKLFQERALYNGEENIKFATFHLHQLETLAPHYALIAGAYNAGINRVSLWWKRFGNLPLDVFVELIPVNETRNYIKLVLRNFIYYKGLRSNGVIEPNLIGLNLPPYNMSENQKVLP